MSIEAIRLKSIVNVLNRKKLILVGTDHKDFVVRVAEMIASKQQVLIVKEGEGLSQRINGVMYMFTPDAETYIVNAINSLRIIADIVFFITDLEKTQLINRADDIFLISSLKRKEILLAYSFIRENDAAILAKTSFVSNKSLNSEGIMRITELLEVDTGKKIKCIQDYDALLKSFEEDKPC